MHVAAFITGTGTNVGKTYVTRGLARAYARRGSTSYALKPIETGVAPDPQDAIALAHACGHSELAHVPEFYRAASPVSPYAASLATGSAAPSVARITARVLELRARCNALFVEGAGGLLVPLDATTTNADLAIALDLPLVVVALNELGVLSAVLTCIESADRRDIPILGTVLVDPPEPDASTLLNRQILSERLSHPVLRFPRCTNDDDTLADAAESAALLDLFESRSGGRR